jgi:CRISPR/Cas system CSM-associated protein Csm4 (group 5 of RAMP superfamily)
MDNPTTCACSVIVSRNQIWTKKKKKKTSFLQVKEKQKWFQSLKVWKVVWNMVWNPSFVHLIILTNLEVK